MPTTLMSLTVVVFAVVPGFIAVSVWARARTWKGSSSDLHTVLQGLAVSLVIQCAMLPLTVAWALPPPGNGDVANQIEEHIRQRPWEVTAWALLAVVVVPVVGGILAARLSSRGQRETAAENAIDERVHSRFLRWFHRLPRIVPPAAPPSIWDYTFNKSPRGFIRVEFTDGTYIGGFYADGSTALTSPEIHGLFIEQEWVLDDEGDFVGPVPESRGIMVPRSEIVKAVRFLKPPDEIPDQEG